MHFHSECPHFEPNRTAAHHLIAKSIISALRGFNPKGWTFWYETSFRNLPFTFEWRSETEESEEQDRRPDGVAFNEAEGIIAFLEFSRPMDQENNMRAAQERKSDQYLAAEKAIRRAANRIPWKDRKVKTVSTLPLLVGVRGSVNHYEAVQALSIFDLTGKKTDRVLAAGVRAAITAASAMIDARTAALPSAPSRGKQQFKPRPWRATAWRADRGWAQG